ncbi:MAG: tetratricopeptide repeat protein [Acidobacteriota bacterium]|nr:tetratricopeptide repeat protein [Acidobacteriota bacterium]
MPDSQDRLNELQARWQADPGSRRVFVQLAEEYRRLGRLEEAVGVLETGLERAPGYVSAQVALGRCRLEAGETDAAVEVLEEVLSQDATQLVANKLLVEGYLQQGRREDARRRLDLYRQLTGEDPEIEALEQRLEETKSGTAAVPDPPAIPADEPSEEPQLEDPEQPEDLTDGGTTAEDGTTGEPLVAAREGVVEDEAPSTSPSSEESEPLFPGLSESPATAQSRPEPDPDDTLFDLSGGGDANRHAQQLSEEGLFDFQPSAPEVIESAPAESGEAEEPSPAPPEAQTAEAPAETPESATSPPASFGASEPQADEPFADLVPPAPVAEEPAAPEAAETAKPGGEDDLFQLSSAPVEASPAGDTIFDLSPPPAPAAAATEEPAPFPDLQPDSEVVAEESVVPALGAEGPEASPAEAETDAVEAEIPSVEELAASASPQPTSEETLPEEPVLERQPAADDLPEEPPGEVPGEVPAELPDLAAEAEAAARELQEEAAAALRAETTAEDEEAGGQQEEPVSATLGQLYLQQGHTEEAEKIFRRVLEREPAHPIALAGLETLAKSRAAEVAEPLEAAVDQEPIAEEPIAEEPIPEEGLAAESLPEEPEGEESAAVEPPEASTAETPLVEEPEPLAAEPEEAPVEAAPAEEMPAEEPAAADEGEDTAPATMAAADSEGLRAEDLLQGTDAEAVAGLTARKVVLLKNYLQRLRAGA